MTCRWPLHKNNSIDSNNICIKMFLNFISGKKTGILIFLSICYENSAYNTRYKYNVYHNSTIFRILVLETNLTLM